MKIAVDPNGLASGTYSVVARVACSTGTRTSCKGPSEVGPVKGVEATCGDDCREKEVLLNLFYCEEVSSPGACMKKGQTGNKKLAHRL